MCRLEPSRSRIETRITRAVRRTDATERVPPREGRPPCRPPRPSPNGRDGARPSPGGPTSVSAAAALAQIKAKGYHENYLRQGKKVTLIGTAFDAEMRNLSDRAIEVA